MLKKKVRSVCERPFFTLNVVKCVATNVTEIRRHFPSYSGTVYISINGGCSRLRGKASTLYVADRLFDFMGSNGLYSHTLVGLAIDSIKN